MRPYVDERAAFGSGSQVTCGLVPYGCQLAEA